MSRPTPEGAKLFLSVGGAENGSAFPRRTRGETIYEFERVVPEPSSVLLFGTGLTVLGRARMLVTHD